MGVGGIRTIEQRITAGGNFDGTLPPGDVERTVGIEKFPPASAGGLFDFGIAEPHVVYGIELKLSGQSSWTIHKRDVEGDELLLMCGLDEESFLATSHDSFVISDQEKLILRTVGASGEMIARVHIRTVVR